MGAAEGPIHWNPARTRVPGAAGPPGERDDVATDAGGGEDGDPAVRQSGHAPRCLRVRPLLCTSQVTLLCCRENSARSGLMFVKWSLKSPHRLSIACCVAGDG